MKLKVYLATNFFTEQGFNWTKTLGYRLRSMNYDVYLPQENGEINDKSSESADIITDVDIANGDNKYLEDADILVASLDGVEIDSGVSAEIGYFSGLIKSERHLSASPKPRYIIGVYTDIRRDGEGNNRFYINLYTKGLVNLYGKVVHSTDEVAEAITEFRNKVIEHNQFGGKH